MRASERLHLVHSRLHALREDRSTSASEKIPLTTELQRLARDIEAGQLCPGDWEDHELNWTVHRAQLRKEVLHRSAQIMFAFEDMRRKNPTFGAGDANFEDLLQWWREDGGREEFLGELPIAERREIEAKAAEWASRDEPQY